MLGYALAAGIGVCISSLWWLALLGLSLFFYDIWYRAGSMWGSAIRGFVLGCALGGAGVWWMWSMVPLPLSDEVSISTQYALAGLVWGVTAILSGVSTALAAVLLYLLRNNTFIVAIAGLIWVLQEEIRMWFFAFYSWAPESLLGPHFSQTAIGYTLAENAHLLQLAQLGGVHFLNFATAGFASLLALLFAWLFSRPYFGAVPNRMMQVGIAGLVSSALLITPLFLRATAPLKEPLSVAVIGNSDAKPEVLLKEIAESNHAVDMIVFPEGDRFFLPDDTLSTVFPDREVLIVGSKHTPNENGKGLQAELFYQHSQNGTLGTYRKIFLMPQGEYYPAMAEPLYALANDRFASTAAPNTGNRLVRGNELTAVPFKGTVVGGLICSDIISPHLYPRLAKNHGASVLLNVSNPDWFHGSHAFYDKMLQIARVHAVHTRSYFISASVGNPSFVLDPRGKIVAQSAWGTEDMLFATLDSSVRGK